MALTLLVQASAADGKPAVSYRRSAPELKTAEPKSTAREFSPIQQDGAETACHTFVAPRLIRAAAGAFPSLDKPLAVDIVIGPDGQVESLLFLQPEDSAADRNIGDRLRKWVYQPALCDGTPVAAEGRLEFRN